MNATRLRALPALLPALVLLAPGCEYNPPPALLSTVPAPGAVLPADGGLQMTFTEPIKPASLRVTLFPRDTWSVDSEFRLLPDCNDVAAGVDCIEPVAGPCEVEGDCPGATLELLPGEDGFTFQPAAELAVGGYTLRVSSGLKDAKGNSTGLPIDLSFSTEPPEVVDVTTFASGKYLTWMQLEKPVPFEIQVYWRFDVDAETGAIVGAGCDGDEWSDAGRQEDYNFQEWIPEPMCMMGFHLNFTGSVQDMEVELEDGSTTPGWFLRTDEFYILNLSIPYVRVINGAAALTIAYNEELGRNEVITGTMQADEIYILTPEGGPYDEVLATIYGYELSAEEMAAEAQTHDNQENWDLCFSLEEATAFGPCPEE